MVLDVIGGEIRDRAGLVAVEQRLRDGRVRPL
jgi:hypothetical protein